MSDVVKRFLALLDDVRDSGAGWSARCPAHDDGHASLSVAEGDDGRVLVTCHAGCSTEHVVRAIGWSMADLFDRRRSPASSATARRQLAAVSTGAGRTVPDKTPAQREPRKGLTLAEYAEAKKLPLEFLQDLGLIQFTYLGKPAVKMPYRNQEGAEAQARFRISMQKNRFRWRKGSKPTLYGLERLAAARRVGYVVLVEGESDAQTMWLHDLPALGLPGASTWQPNWAPLLDGLDVYVWQEPGEGGETMVQRLAESLPQARVLVPPEGLKDISDFHCQGGDVIALMQELEGRAQSLGQLLEDRISRERDRLLIEAGDLPQAPDILAELERLVQELGLAGEARNARLLYLTLTTRLLDHPVSVAVKGPSSGGKSFLTETVLRTMPEEAYHRYTSMSDKALLYTDLDLKHRFLVVMEGTALKGDMAAYIMRSLLSEGGLDHQTVVKGDDGMEGKHLRVEGPTGLLVTTTSDALDAELETRLFSIEVEDDTRQTQAILLTMADKANRQVLDVPDMGSWHALQQWLQTGQHQVAVPYARWVAENTMCALLRLRRDFKAVLQLIKAHAILHQKNRTRYEDGRIVANLADYRVVYELVAHLVAESAGVAVSGTVRETVEAVRRHMISTRSAAKIDDIARELEVDYSTAGRRLRKAHGLGYLSKNRGRKMVYWTGNRLPAKVAVLPSPQLLAGALVGEGGGSISSETGAKLPN